jgi:hypothetical protein
MIGFQIFALILLVVFGMGFILLLRRKPGMVSWLGAGVMIAVLLFLATVLVRPNISNQIAAMAGIGRGADMMLYLAILFLLFISATLYLRTKRLQLMIVELTRSIALLGVETAQRATGPAE